MKAPEEVAQQYYLLARATMAPRNVSSIYAIDLKDLTEDEFSDFLGRFQDEMKKLLTYTEIKAVVLNSHDLSDEDRNDVIQFAEPIGRPPRARPKGNTDSNNTIYFQLQKP